MTDIDLSLLLSRHTKRHILNNRRSALKQRLKSKHAVQRPICEREHYRVAQRRHQALGSLKGVLRSLDQLETVTGSRFPLPTMCYVDYTVFGFARGKIILKK